jgi:hypothetical protein
MTGTNRTTAPHRTRRGSRSEASCCSKFYRERDHTRWLCELRTHPEPYGVEAQFFRNEEFYSSRRFDQTMSGDCTPREMAIAWAHEWRKGIEEGDL